MTDTPLELPGWLEFNTWRTGLVAHRFESSPSSDAGSSAVFYVDRRGRLRLPPNNPYVHVAFRTSSKSPSRRTADWHRVAEPLVAEMRARGVVNQLHLPPDIDDVRPWAAGGFLVGVGYTYTVELPFDDALMDRNMRRGIDKARRLGLRAERVDDHGHVLAGLLETESRKRFSHRLGLRELREASRLIGGDHLRMYAAFDASGVVQGSMVVVHAPGARSISWLAGTSIEGLANGAGPYLSRFAFDDLASAGASGIDLCGANIPSVAAHKSRWGGQLRPTYDVRSYSLRAAARFAASWLSSRGRSRRGGHRVSPDTNHDRAIA